MSCDLCGKGALISHGCMICSVSMCTYSCLMDHEKSKHGHLFTEEQIGKLRDIKEIIKNNAEALKEKKDKNDTSLIDVFEVLKVGIESRSIDDEITLVKFLQRGKSLRGLIYDSDIKGLGHKAMASIFFWISDIRSKELDKLTFDNEARELIAMLESSINSAFE